MQILVVILIISFLILIHEAGHFLMARRAGVKVEEFGLGYPPKILSMFNWRGTEFTLNLIPVGGFVRLFGEHGPEAVEQDEEESKAVSAAQISPSDSADKAFYRKSAQSRMAVILAGVVVNILFAIAAFSVVFSFMGIPTPLDNQARIGWVNENSPAAEAGLPTNVNIVEIKSDLRSYRIDGIDDAQQAVIDNRGESITMVVSEQCQRLSCPETTQQFEVYVRTAEETPEDQGATGIIFRDSVLMTYPWYQMPIRGTIYGIRQGFALGKLILSSLGKSLVQLFTQGQIKEPIAGTVGIVYEAQQGNLFEDNFLSYLGFAGMLSLNLGVMNLLPIPALDGGRALFILLEKIIGKKRAQKMETYANYVGMALIILLIITVTIEDISRIIKG